MGSGLPRGAETRDPPGEPFAIWQETFPQQWHTDPVQGLVNQADSQTHLTEEKLRLRWGDTTRPRTFRKSTEGGTDQNLGARHGSFSNSWTPVTPKAFTFKFTSRKALGHFRFGATMNKASMNVYV